MKKKRANQILGVAHGGQRSASFAALMVAGLLLGGCGQKGPLTLPSATPAQAQTAPPTTAPSPAANDTLPARTDAAPH